MAPATAQAGVPATPGPASRLAEDELPRAAADLLRAEESFTLDLTADSEEARRFNAASRSANYGAFLADFDDSLSAELETFRSLNEQDVKAHLNQYVLIQGKRIEGYYATLDLAIENGYRCFGETPFLIEKIST
jgi:hypothetical protein